MTISTQCLECKHYTGLCTCKAFPDKIPQEIFDGSFDHINEYPGDNGIKFEKESNIFKGEKIITVKGTSKRKAHKRRIKVSDKVEVVKLHDGINNIDLITKNDKVIEKILKDGNWNSYSSRFFDKPPKCRDAIIHVKNEEIYAMSKLQSISKSVHIALLEVHPDKQRQGYGIKVMKDIVNTIIDNKNFNKVELTSLSNNSDKFYEAIGMIRTNPKEDYQAEYEGDKEWMKKFMKSI